MLKTPIDLQKEPFKHRVDVVLHGANVERTKLLREEELCGLRLEHGALCREGFRDSIHPGNEGLLQTRRTLIKTFKFLASFFDSDVGCHTKIILVSILAEPREKRCY